MAIWQNSTLWNYLYPSIRQNSSIRNYLYPAIQQILLFGIICIPLSGKFYYPCIPKQNSEWYHLCADYTHHRNAEHLCILCAFIHLLKNTSIRAFEKSMRQLQVWLHGNRSKTMTWDAQRLITHGTQAVNERSLWEQTGLLGPKHHKKTASSKANSYICWKTALGRSNLGGVMNDIEQTKIKYI